MRCVNRCTACIFAPLLAASANRSFGENNSVLGTSPFPVSLMQELEREHVEEETKRRGGIGETLRNCISKGELDHMESPEADEAHLRKLDAMVNNFFAKRPLPPDPMKAALAPTKDEIVQAEKFEVLKEAVRERYLATQAKRRSEDKRIAEAMKEVEHGTHQVRTSLGTYEGEGPTEASFVRPTPQSDAEATRKEIERLKRRLAELEAKQQ
jgi:hypothetical protein